MSFNRRRVALACAYCRHRKRRCDASKPSCKNCIEAEVDCQYDDTPSQRIDSSGGSREILSRLREIETLLEYHLPNLAALAGELPSNGPRHAAASTSPLSMSSLPAVTALQTAQSLGTDIPIPLTPWPNVRIGSISQELTELPPLTIPVKHKTSSNYLLRLPAMQALIGEYPTDLFFMLESRNTLPPALSFERLTAAPPPVDLDKEMLDFLVASFFSQPYFCHPIPDRDEFQAIYHNFLNTGPDSGVESALCMVVFALGAASSHGPGAEAFDSLPPGMAYMQHAMPTLISTSSWSFSYSIVLPQALVLASVYFAYIIRPLQSWRLVYEASTVLQFKLARLSAQEEEPSSRESILRIFWSCFLVECDRLAELELPQSGLQQLIDQTSLPSCSNLESMQSMWYLAEISIRRLLNRIHNSLYPKKKQNVLSLSSTSLTACDDFSAEEISSVTSICDELYRQLVAWYESIPESFRPSLGTEPTGNDRATVLRIRYFAARHIIHRPFVLFITSQHESAVEISPVVLEKARICIESCRAYLHNTTEILGRQSQYTWTFSLSSFGAVVVLTLASRSASLRHLVQDIDELQSVAINNIKPWAYPGSSLEAVLSIMQDMQRKQRILRCF